MPKVRVTMVAEGEGDTLERARYKALDDIYWALESGGTHWGGDPDPSWGVQITIERVTDAEGNGDQQG